MHRRVRGLNVVGVLWTNERLCAAMRMLGTFEVRSDWCYVAKDVAGIDNELADGVSISKWE